MISSKYQQLCLTTLSLIIGTIGIISLQKNNLQTQSINKEQTSYLQEQQTLKAEVELQKNTPSFGFNNLIADWNYLQFIQYFGDTQARESTGYPLVTDYFEILVDKDPYFTQAFLSFSAANSLFAAQPQKTVTLINKVLESVPPNLPGYPFLLWTYKAADEILFLGDLEAAKHSYENAAKWASLRQDNIGNEMAARYEKSAAFLATKPDPTQAQIGAWMNILSTARDEKTVKYVIQELKELGVEVSISDDGKLNIKQIK
jgi:hypothetical protein